MLIRVYERLSKPGVYAVASATGTTNRDEMQTAAQGMIAEHGIGSPHIEIIDLNSAERSSQGDHLIIVKQSDR